MPAGPELPNPQVRGRSRAVVEPGGQQPRPDPGTAAAGRVGHEQEVDRGVGIGFAARDLLDHRLLVLGVEDLLEPPLRW